ncbi:MAG: hypothetical protein GY913_00440 [Proteobacteria bacterium]|nr:hypothetical protein [Pseudomonadota bacterium]
MTADDSARSGSASTELLRLEALGYVAFAENAPDRGGGVIVDTDAAQTGGGRLIVFAPSCTALIMDNAGTVMKRWSDANTDCAMWSGAELLADGTLVVPSRSDAGERGLVSIDPDMNQTTECITAHHDTATSERGEMYIALITTLDPGIRSAGTRLRSSRA